jgi:hypothetical protein
VKIDGQLVNQKQLLDKTLLSSATIRNLIEFRIAHSLIDKLLAQKQ